MKAEQSIQSISEQILADLFIQLSQDERIPPALIEDLRRLAADGKMDDSAEIMRIISIHAGGRDETH